MNWGALLVQIVREWAPFSQEKRAARKARRIARKSPRVRQHDELEGEFLPNGEDRRMAIDLGTRTSTNAFVGGTFLTQLYVQLVALIPGMGDIEAFLLQPESIAFAGVLIAAIIARFSKTPVEPKVL